MDKKKTMLPRLEIFSLPDAIPSLSLHVFARNQPRDKFCLFDIFALMVNVKVS